MSRNVICDGCSNEITGAYPWHITVSCYRDKSQWLDVCESCLKKMLAIIQYETQETHNGSRITRRRR